MPTWYQVGKDRSAFYRGIRQYFLAKGITSEAKINSLTFRWIRQKGYRLPITT